MPSAIMNIVLLSDAIEKGFIVFIDSKLDNASYVADSKRRTVSFPCNEEGLYMNETGCTFKKKDENGVIIMTNTIEGFTPKQVARAVRAKKLYHDLYAETVDNLKIWIRSNITKNVPVGMDDVNEMVRIFSNDVAPLKGKSVEPHPPVVNRNDVIELPPELKVKGMRIESAIDVVYINDQSFLHSVDQTIKLRGVAHLGTRKKDQNYTKDMLFVPEGIDTILRHYDKNDI